MTLILFTNYGRAPIRARVNKAVIPPTGLFTLNVATLLRTVLSIVPEEFVTDVKNLPTVTTNEETVVFRFYTMTFVEINALIRGQTKQIFNVSRRVGTGSPPSRRIILLVTKLVMT